MSFLDLMLLEHISSWGEEIQETFSKVKSCVIIQCLDNDWSLTYVELHGNRKKMWVSVISNTQVVIKMR